MASRSTAATICWLHQHLLHNVSIHRKYISLSVTINSPSVSTVLAISPFSIFAGRPSLLLLVGFSLVTLGWLLVVAHDGSSFSDYIVIIRILLLVTSCYYHVTTHQRSYVWNMVKSCMPWHLALPFQSQSELPKAPRKRMLEDGGGCCHCVGTWVLLSFWVISCHSRKKHKKTMTHCHIWLLKATWNSLRWLYHGLSEDRVPMGTPISYHLKWNVESESHDIFRHFPPIFVELLFEGGSCSKRST